MQMCKYKRLVACFAMGAAAYSLLEIVWRRKTHWSMALAGATCFTLLCALNARLHKKPLWLRCLAGSAIISCVEFLTGCIVNLALGWNVWNYSKQRLHLLGQICPLYSCLWFLLCIPVNALTRLVAPKGLFR